MGKRTSCKKKRTPVSKWHQTNQSQPGTKVKAAPQPPISGPLQSVQVQEFSDSEDLDDTDEDSSPV